MTATSGRGLGFLSLEADAGAYLLCHSLFFSVGTADLIRHLCHGEPHPPSTAHSLCAGRTSAIIDPIIANVPLIYIIVKSYQ